MKYFMQHDKICSKIGSECPEMKHLVFYDKICSKIGSEYLDINTIYNFY